MTDIYTRSDGRTSEAPPDERGGYRYVRPTATASHLDSTHLGNPVAVGPAAAAYRFTTTPVAGGPAAAASGFTKTSGAAKSRRTRARSCRRTRLSCGHSGSRR